MVKRPADRSSPGRHLGTWASRPDDGGLLRKLFGKTLLGGKSGRRRCRGEEMSARRSVPMGWAQQRVRALSRQQLMWACPS